MTERHIDGIPLKPWGLLTPKQQRAATKKFREYRESQEALKELVRVLSDRAILEAYWEIEAKRKASEQSTTRNSSGNE